MPVKVQVIYEGPGACNQCLGWGSVADTEDRESWKYWAELPAQSAFAVRAGIVKPIECPRCKGTGREPKAGLPCPKCRKPTTESAESFDCPSCNLHFSTVYLAAWWAGYRAAEAEK